MNEPKPDFSVTAALFPHINPEGLKFGGIALALAFVVAILASHFWWLVWLVVPVVWPVWVWLVRCCWRCISFTSADGLPGGRVW